jgi:hypothetical protein
MTNQFDDDAVTGFDETDYYPENMSRPRDLDLQPLPTPILPFLLFGSGLYSYRSPVIGPIPPLDPIPRPIPRPIPINPDIPIPDPQPGPRPIGAQEESTEAAFSPIFGSNEDLRLDIDGRYPQMTASGKLFRQFGLRTHWIASLTKTAANTYNGSIWYKDGNVASFPYTNVTITVVKSIFANQRKAIVVYSGGGSAVRTRTFGFVSSYFHKVEFEYDCETGAPATLSYNTASHPTRPASLPLETVSIERIFQRAGFDATRSPNSTIIPNDGPDPGTQWSDAEMHDAMQTYWSRFANKPQWAMWVLFAKQHDLGSSLGGIMFDSIGPNHRQGTAIFTNSFVATAPAGDANPAAWVNRMFFWTAIHEMGHGFNLAHSWQKHLGTPWIPLTSDGEARSFMNYPYNVSGGQSAFFSNFEFRFIDQELLFMRHAPERFVEMGNANWFDHHGFQQQEGTLDSGFELELRVDRARPMYEFLEPVVVELKLTNVSQEPKIVPESVLKNLNNIMLITKKDGRAARNWAPYAHYCMEPKAHVLRPGESITDSVFVSVGSTGWMIDEPGNYSVQAAMQLEGFDLVSNPLRLRVAPPRGYDEEYVAQEVFTDEAGRVMAFDGSQVLDNGIAAWEELVDRLPKSRAAVHARVALAMPKTKIYRTLDVDAVRADKDVKKQFKFSKVDTKRAHTLLTDALLDAPEAVETLGRVDYEYYTDKFSAALKKQGDEKEARRVSDAAEAAISEANAPSRSRRKTAA